MIDAGALFARHLDLAALGARRRGVVRCCFHEDSTPSLSIDLGVGVFHCFGCGAQGGVMRFAELVGERPSVPAAASAHSEWESPLMEARRDVLRLARRQPWNREEYQLRNVAADAIRYADRVMRSVTVESEHAWDVIEHAARLATEGEALWAAAERRT